MRVAPVITCFFPFIKWDERLGFWPRFYIVVLGIRKSFTFHSLFGFLYPFSIWTFISLLYLDFYIPFLFGLFFFNFFFFIFFSILFSILFLFYCSHILDFFEIFFSIFHFLPPKLFDNKAKDSVWSLSYMSRDDWIRPYVYYRLISD